MAFQQNDNSGALFKNTDKDDEHPNWPDYQGKATIGGTFFYISAWLKTDKNGDKYMSLAFNLPRENKAPTKQKSAADDDSIPF